MTAGHRRRSLTSSRRGFSVAAFSFCDDKYGFESEVRLWARFDQQKLQLCSDPTILGVTYDLDQYLFKNQKVSGARALRRDLVDPRGSGAVAGSGW